MTEHKCWSLLDYHSLSSSIRLHITILCHQSPLRSCIQIVFWTLTAEIKAAASNSIFHCFCLTFELKASSSPTWKARKVHKKASQMITVSLMVPVSAVFLDQREHWRPSLTPCVHVNLIKSYLNSIRIRDTFNTKFKVGQCVNSRCWKIFLFWKEPDYLFSPSSC